MSIDRYRLQRTSLWYTLDYLIVHIIFAWLQAVLITDGIQEHTPQLPRPNLRTFIMWSLGGQSQGWSSKSPLAEPLATRKLCTEQQLLWGRCLTFYYLLYINVWPGVDQLLINAHYSARWQWTEINAGQRNFSRIKISPADFEDVVENKEHSRDYDGCHKEPWWRGNAVLISNLIKNWTKSYHCYWLSFSCE